MRAGRKLATVPLRSLLAWGREQLERAALPAIEAEWLLRWALDQESLVMAPQEVGIRAAENYRSAIAQRRSRVPLQHITGTMQFRGMELKAGPGVFSTRPETELLAEYALKEAVLLSTGGPAGRGAAPQHEANEPAPAGAPARLSIADLCAGSGAIGLSLASELAERRHEAGVVLVELDHRALSYLRANAESIDTGDNSVDVVHGDAITALPGMEGTLDLVVSNPPYVGVDDAPTQPEAKADPPAALYGGGEDGLVIPRGVIGRAFELLRVGGVLLMEHGERQGEALVDHALSVGFSDAETLPDLVGRPRFLRAVKSAQDEGAGTAGSALLDAVRRGELVVLPTDTVYGIGSNPWSRDAVTRLLAAKGRGETMPPPVLVPGIESLDELAEFATEEQREAVTALARRFWPGPLTIVVKAKRDFGWDTSVFGGTVALRMPAHPLALEVLRQAGPLAVTSANRTGEPPAQTVEEAREAFGSAVAIYVDGGPTGSAVPSTIVDATVAGEGGPAWRVLRQGALGLEQLERGGPAPGGGEVA